VTTNGDAREVAEAAEVEGIRYAVCREADLAELIPLVARTFATNDPPAVAVGLTADELEAYLARAAGDAGRDGLTIVARAVATGQLAGALLALDAAADPASIDGLSPKLEPVMGIFAALDAALDEELGGPQPPVAGQTLYLLMLAVADGFARRGIAQELVRACLANGARLGYRRAETTATNLVSQHIFGKLGFVTRAQVSYAGYRHQGRAVFASIADVGGPIAMARDFLAR
jgi:ribosomal protein S18 acetylase RimI-like enzyme